MKWWLRGEYVESCNCQVLCPCLLGPRDEYGRALARPTEGGCDNAVFFHIEQGHFDSLDLAGLNVAMVISTPGPMAEGN